MPEPEDLKESQIAAMDAIFAFDAAMTAGGLTIGDLTEVFRLAIEDGWDMLLIDLNMAITAIGFARPQETHP